LLSRLVPAVLRGVQVWVPVRLVLVLMLMFVLVLVLVPLQEVQQ
jgi:hypothetical protein